LGPIQLFITGPIIDVPGADQNVIPIVRVEPVYPQRALDRGIEGWVEVEFTVTEVGGVSEPTILGSRPSGVFDRAALRAIERWKYEPKVVDGQPVPRPGMRNRFLFQVTEAGSRSH
jgi:protein TonB